MGKSGGYVDQVDQGSRSGQVDLVCSGRGYVTIAKAKKERHFLGGWVYVKLGILVIRCFE